MSSHEPCGRDGCARPRIRYSVFCDEHHDEQLERVGLARFKPQAPEDRWMEHLKKCQQVLWQGDEGISTTEEVAAMLADVLVHCQRWDGTQCLRRCLDALPEPDLAQLLAYLKVADRPHGFFLTSDAKREAARAAQSVLVAELESRFPDNDA